MNEKFEVLGLQIDNLFAKDALKHVVSYVKTEPLSIVELITMNTLGKYQEIENLSDVFENVDLTLASDKGILQAAGIRDERRIKEANELLFLKLVMKYLHKNSVKVFLLAETALDLQKLAYYIQEDYEHIQIIETATIETQGASDDMLLNQINGAEVDCVLSALPSPMEEQFVSRNKLLINARLWLGLGNLLDEMKNKKSGFRKVKEFVLRQLLKKEIAKKGENA